MTLNAALQIGFDHYDRVVEHGRIAVARDQKSNKHAGVQEQILRGRGFVF